MLYRKLTARGVLCYVCAPDSSRQRRKRVKNNKIDARSYTSQLFNDMPAKRPFSVMG